MVFLERKGKKKKKKQPKWLLIFWNSGYFGIPLIPKLSKIFSLLLEIKADLEHSLSSMVLNRFS